MSVEDVARGFAQMLFSDNPEAQEGFVSHFKQAAIPDKVKGIATAIRRESGGQPCGKDRDDQGKPTRDVDGDYDGDGDDSNRPDQAKKIAVLRVLAACQAIASDKMRPHLRKTRPGVKYMHGKNAGDMQYDPDYAKSRAQYGPTDMNEAQHAVMHPWNTAKQMMNLPGNLVTGVGNAIQNIRGQPAAAPAPVAPPPAPVQAAPPPPQPVQAAAPPQPPSMMDKLKGLLNRANPANSAQQANQAVGVADSAAGALTKLNSAKETAKKVFRGAAGGYAGMRLGSMAGRGAGRLAGAATGIAAHQSGGSSPVIALLLGQGAGDFLSMLGGMAGGAAGAYKGYQIGTEHDHEPAPETKLGFIGAWLEEQHLTLDSQPMEKTAWSGIPQKAKGTLREEMERIASLTGIAGEGRIKSALDYYSGGALPRTLGQFEGSYSIADMMGIMEESDRCGNPEAARKMKETL